MRERLLFSEPVRALLERDPLVLVDAGARGSVEDPWASLPEGCLRVVGFEPDEEECERLAAARPGDVFLPVALWSELAEVDVHVAEVPACTSVHPPNWELLARFRNQHATPRTTQRVARYPATTLDSALALAGVAADFLKVDTQGAELEILRGGAERLRGEILGAIVETWTAEVHRGQGLTGEVLQLMAELGFSLFDVQVAAAWERRAAEGLELAGKRQVVGLDLLFLKEPAALTGDVRLIKAAAVADVYGYPDYALELLASVGDETTAGTLRDRVVGATPPPKRRRRLPLLGGRGPAEEPPFARLHN